MNRISDRGIRAFLNVAKHGSFTAAAKACGVSKANLSQLVTDLESALGVQLLTRTTRRLRLTAVGEGYYEKCKSGMQQLDAAAEWATETTEALKGVIRMNAVGGPIGEDVIAPLVIGFQQKHPGLHMQLDFSSMRVDLVEHHYDLVMRMGEMPDSTLIARTLRTITTHYVASPGFLERHGPIRKPDDLKRVPLIYGSVDHWVLKRGKEQRLVRVEGGLRMVSGRAMRHAALASLGVTRLGDIYVEADIDNGRLVEVLPHWSDTTKLSLVCPPVRHQLARMRALMDWLCQRFEARYQDVLREGMSV